MNEYLQTEVEEKLSEFHEYLKYLSPSTPENQFNLYTNRLRKLINDIYAEGESEGFCDGHKNGKELGYAMGYHAATKGEPPKYNLGEWLDDCDSSN